MIRHLVAWRFLPSQTAEQKQQNALALQEKFSRLQSKIPDIVSIKLETEMLGSSDYDIMLNSVFASDEALKAYQKHPEHIAVGQLIKTLTKDRVAIDYAENE